MIFFVKMLSFNKETRFIADMTKLSVRRLLYTQCVQDFEEFFLRVLRPKRLDFAAPFFFFFLMCASVRVEKPLRSHKLVLHGCLLVNETF